MKKNRGFALIVAIFVVVVFAVLGVVAVSLLSGESIMAMRDLHGIQALELAEAGLKHALAYQLSGDDDWSDNTGYSKNLSPGSFTISYTYNTKNRVTLQVTGVVSGVSRTIQSTVKRGGLPAAFGYGMYSANQGGDPLVIENSATIFGDFYFKGDVTMKNSSRLLNGTMYSDSLTLLNSATCASWEPAPDVPLPTLETGYYDTLLAETTRSASSSLRMSSGTLALAGTTRYYTSINLSGSAIVTGPGMLVATTGNFTLQNSARLGDNIIVVAKQQASFQNSAQVGNDVKIVANDDININNGQNFLPEALIFSYGNIDFDNTSYYYGSFICPNGQVSSLNSTKFRGLIYAGTIDMLNSTNLIGSIVLREGISHFRNSSTVTYDPSYLPTEWPPGLEGGVGASEEGTSDWLEVY
ncbi:hypothetical protein HZC35_06520 [Candidatus Saganbacteria bacterium]|nr:hypothetical protein [Candidatus Saganbacteria bacterium]